MPAGELRRHDAVVNVRQGRRLPIPEVMDREHDGDLAPPRQVDHADGRGISAVREQDIRPEDLQIPMEELQDGADLLRPGTDVTGGIQPHDRNWYIAPAGV